MTRSKIADIYYVSILVMLYLVGLGLGSVEDLTQKGLKCLKKCRKIYLEGYTSLVEEAGTSTGSESESVLKQLEELTGVLVEIADRQAVEDGAEAMIEEARTENVALVVVGDVFGATTHSDIYLRAQQCSVPIEVVHNASIMNAVACCGLQLYSFGETVSLCLWSETSQPDSYYEKILGNYSRGLHTLCLLDIKLRERSVENMMRNRKIYEPARFMLASEAAAQLIEIGKRRKRKGTEDGTLISLPEDCTAIALARIGWSTQKLVTATLQDMAVNGKIVEQLGGPLHCLVIAGKVHPLEQEMIDLWKLK